MSDYLFFRTCVECGAPEDLNALNIMTRTAEDSTYEEMLENCVGLLEWSASVGYDPYCDEGLALEDDQMVGYHKSHFRNEEVYYLAWSGFEIIWIKRGVASDEEKWAATRCAEHSGEDQVGRKASRRVWPQNDPFKR